MVNRLDLSSVEERLRNELANAIISPQARPGYAVAQNRLARLEQLTREKPVTAFPHNR